MAKVHIKFWGVRGSFATPDRAKLRFGGNTMCVGIRHNNEIFICDAGTGIVPLGIDLAHSAGKKPLYGTILISHLHWDHFTGLPFFKPFSEKKNRFVVIGPAWRNKSFAALLNESMAAPFFPIRLTEMPARISLKTISSRPFKTGSARITTMPLNHFSSGVGWRFDFGHKKSVVVMFDNQPGTAARDRKLIKWMRGAEVLIHEAQYTPSQYRKKGSWGHSPFTYPIELAALAGVKKVYLTHFAPEASDKKLAQTERAAKKFERRFKVKVAAAREGYQFLL